MSHYKHLTIEERESLYLMRGQGKGVRAIARELGRAASTISRELARNKKSHRPYRPSAAQRRYETCRKSCGRKPVLADEDKREVVRRLIEDLTWSPEQVQHRLKLESHSLQISYATIYRAIHAGIFDQKGKYLRKRDRFTRFLRRKGKKRKKNGAENKQGKIQVRYTIHQRPSQADDRSELGHWEADTVAGKRGTGCILTLTDRKSRFLLAKRIPSPAAEPAKTAMLELLFPLPDALRKSVTPDRGHEFAAYQQVEDALPGLTFFFADPASPWQRGTNENTNGLLRERFPKYSDFSSFSDPDLFLFVALLNSRPRKSLNWRSPLEIFSSSLLHLT